MEEQVSEIKFDKNFIKSLLEKLKVGNTRSIHLNAIPGRSAVRLDLFDLSKIDVDIIKKEELSTKQVKNTPEKFIDTILSNESFSFDISYDAIDLWKLDEDEKRRLSLLSKKLDTLVIENDDNFLEFWIKNFGFGFPLLIKRDRNDPTKIIKAPLFIWSLDIEKSYQHKNIWTIKKDKDFPIKLNELLISHIEKDESVQLKKISKEILEDWVVDKKELLELCHNVLSQLNVDNKELKIKIEKCPDKKTIESISNSNAWIQWSGIFGIYRSQKETIIQSTEKLLEKADEFKNEKLVLEKFQTSTISAVETDPSKEEIINTLTKNEIKLIQWPPWTGKSQSITAIISNALVNGARCLVVCEKKTALDVIQKNLEKIWLKDFSVVIDDVNKDRKKVIQKARDIKDNKDYNYFSQYDFEDKYKKFCKLKKDLNDKYAESLKIVFWDFSWKDLIGNYLHLSKSDNFKKILDKLNYDFLYFTYEEYSKYLSIVDDASYLYWDLTKDSEIFFSKLNNELFINKYNWETNEKVKKETKDFLTILESFSDFLSKKNQNDCEEQNISIFKLNSIKESKIIIEDIFILLQKIENLYKKGVKLAGEKFNDKSSWSNFTFSFYSIFTSKYKEVCNIRKEIQNILDKITEKIKILEKFGFKDFKIRKIDEYLSLEELNNDIIAIKKRIEKIRFKIIELEIFQSKIQNFEKNLERIISNKIYNIKLKKYIELGNLEKIKNYYLNLKIEISTINKNIISYESFHNWKYFELKCSKNENLILSVLKDIPTEEWKDIFKAWYYRGALFSYEANSKIWFNKSDTKLQQLDNIITDLKEQQLDQIKNIWENKRESCFSSFNYNFNALYNLRKNKIYNRCNSLRKLVETDIELFTTLFPVILTNPATVNAIFPLKQGLFEIVIFDEASQLRIADTFTSFIRGQYKIIAGDKHQMPPSNYFLTSSQTLDIDNEDFDNTFTENEEQSILADSESLLQYAEDLKNINKSYLDFHYRSEHPSLIEFSNAAFYWWNLISFPEKENYNPIDFRSVNGRYESKTNPEEIAEVVKILREDIHPNQKGKYPSIGIATFNINQRNLIIETLNQVAEQNLSFAKKLQELKERGLFVKNLENIQWDERDIIIISTTYGIKADWKFSQNFARLNRIEWYKLLNVLITRAKKKLYVCTSIPKEKYLWYSEIIQNEGNNKKGILYAYLAYAEAISNNDNETAESILRILKEQSFESPRIISQDDWLSESPFEEEVYNELLEHIEKDKIIQQYKIWGFRLDFLVKINEKNIVLECDGKTYHQSDEAYAYDMYRQKELENMWFIVYRIWSTNWFQDKEYEMQKFLNFVNSIENK